MKKVLLAGAAVLALSGVALGDIWNEVGDAGGDTGVGSAQITVGSGPLDEIRGAVGVDDIVDLYGIRITDFTQFRASVVGGATWDTQLFLFNADGTGQVENDDFSGLQSEITNQGVFSNGIYYLGITRWNADPRNANGETLFGFDTWPGNDPGQRRPIEGRGPVASWTSSTAGAEYTIFLSGASFQEVPAPGAFALLGLGGIAAAGRRRRQA